jgi:hypothetical protein
MCGEHGFVSNRSQPAACARLLSTSHAQAVNTTIGRLLVSPCRSLFLPRYFGEEHPPPCETCDRCRAGLAAATSAGASKDGRPG